MVHQRGLPFTYANNDGFQLLVLPQKSVRNTLSRTSRAWYTYQCVIGGSSLDFLGYHVDAAGIHLLDFLG